MSSLPIPFPIIPFPVFPFFLFSLLCFALFFSIHLSYHPDKVIFFSFLFFKISSVCHFSPLEPFSPWLFPPCSVFIDICLYYSPFLHLFSQRHVFFPPRKAYFFRAISLFLWLVLSMLVIVQSCGMLKT